MNSFRAFSQFLQVSPLITYPHIATRRPWSRFRLINAVFCSPSVCSNSTVTNGPLQQNNAGTVSYSTLCRLPFIASHSTAVTSAGGKMVHILWSDLPQKSIYSRKASARASPGDSGVYCWEESHTGERKFPSYQGRTEYFSQICPVLTLFMMPWMI